MYNSMFGYEGPSASAFAYDMMVLQDIAEKDEKEVALRQLYGIPTDEAFLDEEEVPCD